MKQKYYAVRKGRQPGIYQDWESCKAQVDGFAGAQYKSFSTREDAAQYMAGQNSAPSVSGKSAPRERSHPEPIPAGQVVIYADGARSGIELRPLGPDAGSLRMASRELPMGSRSRRQYRK